VVEKQKRAVMTKELGSGTQKQDTHALSTDDITSPDRDAGRRWRPLRQL